MVSNEKCFYHNGEKKGACPDGKLGLRSDTMGYVGLGGPLLQRGASARLMEST